MRKYTRMRVKVIEKVQEKESKPGRKWKIEENEQGKRQRKRLNSLQENEEVRDVGGRESDKNCLRVLSYSSTAMLTNEHTRSHTHTHSTHTHTHTRTQTHTHTHPHAHKHPHPHTHAHKHTHTHAQISTQTHKYTQCRKRDNGEKTKKEWLNQAKIATACDREESLDKKELDKIIETDNTLFTIRRK